MRDQIFTFPRAKSKSPHDEGFCLNMTNEIGSREWDRTTDHHHVKVMLYH